MPFKTIILLVGCHFLAVLNAQTTIADFTGTWRPEYGDPRMISVNVIDSTVEVFICIDGKKVPVNGLTIDSNVICFKAVYGSDTVLQKLFLVNEKTLQAWYLKRDEENPKEYMYYKESPRYTIECKLED